MILSWVLSNIYEHSNQRTKKIYNKQTVNYARTLHYIYTNQISDYIMGLGDNEQGSSNKTKIQIVSTFNYVLKINLKMNAIPIIK